MPIIDRLTSTAAVARLRAQADRLRRWVMAPRPIVRWGLALAVILALAAASYWGATSLTTFGVRYLASERKFSSDDLIKVCRALDKQLIPYRIDDQRRVEVAGDQFEQAAELVSKLDLGQHPVDEIRSESGTWSFWESAGEREHRELAPSREDDRAADRRARGGHVVGGVDQPPPRIIDVTTELQAFGVRLHRDGGGPSLPSRTVQTIPVILIGYEPDLTPGSITVMDRRGKKYLEPGNPALGDNSRNRSARRRSAKRSSRSSIGSRECGLQCR